MSWFLKLIQILKYIPEAWRIGKAIYDLIVGKTPTKGDEPVGPVGPDEDNKPKRRKRWWRRG